MGIQRKLLSGYLIIAIVTAIVAYFSLRSTEILNSSFTQVTEQTLPIVGALNDMRYHGALMIAHTSELALGLAVAGGDSNSQMQEEEDEIAAAMRDYKHAQERYAQIISSHEHALSNRDHESDLYTLDLINASSQHLLLLLGEMVDLQKSGPLASATLAKMEDIENYEHALLMTIDAALANEVAGFTSRKRDVLKSMLYARNTTAGFGPISILVAILIAVYISRMVVKAVHSLKNASLAMAAGNLNVRVPLVSRDEFGDLARSFNDMAASLREKNNEINATRAYLDEIIHAAGDLIIFTDPENHIRMIGRAICDLLGYTGDELEGKSVAGVFATNIRSLISSKWLPKLKDGIAIHDAEVNFIDRLGHEKAAVISACAVRDQKGIIHGLVYIGRSTKQRAAS